MDFGFCHAPHEVITERNTWPLSRTTSGSEEQKMNRLAFKRLLHLPRRIVREWLMVVHIFWFFLLNRLTWKSVTEPGGPVVSMTTYRARSKRVYLAIESIAKGDVRPSRFILWIDDETLFSHLPATIRRLEKRGVEIKLCANYGPHKKYYPYVEFQKQFDAPLVTADDDLLYPRYWLTMLIEANRKFPNVVNSFWTHVIEIDNEGIGKYADWKQSETTNATFRNIIHSGIGTIYPPAFLIALKRAGNAFQDCCPQADDLWLHVQALRAGFKVRQILPRLPYFSFQSVPGSETTALSYKNVTYGDGNDRQVKATYTEADIRKLQADKDAAV